jgi:poly(3-hydroxybutyrate) depolymerase
MHDREDPTVPFSEGEKTRERARARNHCSARVQRLADGCVRYEDCDPGTPVIWCETEGQGHSIDTDNAPERVWDFFRSLP